MTEASGHQARGQPNGNTWAFTGRGALRGARRCLPLAVSTVAFGLLFGVLSKQAGLSLGEACLMSALVFTGSGQLVAISMWTTPVPILAIVATTLLLGLRHVLMGLTLRPWFSRLPSPRAHAAYFLLTDESWALTTVEFESGAVDAAFLCGAGLVLYGSWVASTALGGITGAAIRHPEAWGLDFAFVGAFIALLSSLARERSVLFPWTLAAGVAVAAHHWLPGNWYVLLGGMSGSVPRLLRASRE